MRKPKKKPKPMPAPSVPSQASCPQCGRMVPCYVDCGVLVYECVGHTVHELADRLRCDCGHALDEDGTCPKAKGSGEDLVAKWGA